MNRRAGRDRTSRKRVAVIHHHALLREGVCRIVESGDFGVVYQGDDGQSLLERFDDLRPEIVLLEWEAPGVCPSLVERLVAAGMPVTIVIMTRPDTLDDLSLTLAAGAAGCLSVNLGAAEFLAAMRMLAQGDVLVSHDMVAAVTSPGGDQERPQSILTSRELEVLQALGRGATNREIAAELFISEHTVKIHVRHILTKMGLRNRQQAAAYAATEGLL